MFVNVETGQPGARKSFFYGYAIVAIALFMMVIFWGTYYAFGVFFKPMSAEFGWTRAATSGAFSLSMFVQGFTGIAVGVLNDRLGPRVVMTICGLAAGLGYLLMSQINSVWQFYLFYGVIIGIGMSGSWIPLLSTVARWFTVRRNLMTGIILTGTGVGGLIGPPVSDWLISLYDWRRSFIMIGVAVLVLIVVAAQLLRRDPSQKGQVPYGEKEIDGNELKFGVEGLSVREAAGTRQFWFLFFSLVGFGFAMFAAVVHIVPHATDLGFSSASAASLIAAMGGAQIVGRVVLGNAADRIGNKKAFVIGYILMTVSLFWLIPARSIWLLVLFSLFYGFGQGGAGVQESPLIAQLFGLRAHGLMMGVVGIGFNFGGTAGPLVTGYLFDITKSYQLAFLVCAVLSLLGMLLIVPLTPVKERKGRTKTLSSKF